MTRVLIVKMSSLGDVVHTLPALTDAKNHNPDLRFDWVVEGAFSEIPRMHPAVNQIFHGDVRRWRKSWWQAYRSGELSRFRAQLREVQYDAIIDAQGLLKSALIAWQARGPRWGLDARSAREGKSAIFYNHRVKVPRKRHAVQRTRQLFSKVFGYEVPERLDYGLQLPFQEKSAVPYMVFLHGTTWATKHWPESYWHELGRIAQIEGFLVKLPWGNEAEKARAERIAATCSGEVLPKCSLTDLAKIMSGASGIVAQDSGLTHLAAALDIPTVSLYGPTNPDLSSPLGNAQKVLQVQFPCAPCMLKTCSYRGPRPVEPPCFQTLPPEKVWSQIQALRD